MRAALGLLTLLCLLWCGLHIAEPAAAHDTRGEPMVAVEGAPPADPCDEGSDRGAHTGHHHCPIAADQRLADAAASPPISAAMLVSVRTDVLASLTRAPPLQPPAA